jgi:hypothetical protein
MSVSVQLDSVQASKSSGRTVAKDGVTHRPCRGAPTVFGASHLRASPTGQDLRRDRSEPCRQVVRRRRHGADITAVRRELERLARPRRDLGLAESLRKTSGRCIDGDLGSQRSPSRRPPPGSKARNSLPRDSADHLTPRQQAALDVIAARHPRPITSTQLATELQLPPEALNVTLRSLQRRQLIVAVPATPRRRGGWTLWPWR